MVSSIALARGRTQRKTWCTEPYPGVQSRLQHIYHGPPSVRVDLNPMPESTLCPRQGLWIWPQRLPGRQVATPLPPPTPQLFLLQSELGLPQPLTRRRVCPPPHPVQGGGHKIEKR
jgi:hypothetical protein